MLYFLNLGRDKTFQKVKERYFWRGMFKDISDFVKKCMQCQYTNKKTETTVPEMIPVPIEPIIWSKIGIDLKGPINREKGLPLSEKGYRFVKVILF